jgi:thymidylate synthase (FAD)|tara:strand:+ start:3470 stop:4144 length:675 start_codon:yes stop_codon:yes gene_type:complete
MEVTFLDKLGTDLSVVDAARVSFGNKSQWQKHIPAQGIYELSDKDKKLIKYLAKHNHWSPFAHTSIQIRVKAPIFVARQLVKHQVGLCWNEVSRRYVDSEPEFYFPEVWRGRPTDKKQGSSDEVIVWVDREERAGTALRRVCRDAVQSYNKMIEAGVTPEQARMILPQNTYTEWVWTGSVLAFARICNLRCKADAQKETQEVAWQIDEIVRENFPVSWNELREE